MPKLPLMGNLWKISIKRSIILDKWNQTANKLKWSSMESQQINKKIDETRALLYRAYDKLLQEDQVITAERIKTRYLKSDQ